MKNLVLIIFMIAAAYTSTLAQQPVVAIHASELTQALETIPAGSSTPQGWGTTGYEWWTSWWHYFVMPESVKEALRSDGTPYVTVSDADISAGGLLTASGLPKYPIVISLASEAIRDDEIIPLINYVNAGGFLLVGSSSYTRNPNGTTRQDFALASSMGLHMVNSNLQNWAASGTFTATTSHRLISHMPDGTLNWQMPLTSEDDSLSAQYLWQTSASSATVIATGDNGLPYLAVKAYGKGYFIYDAAMQPLMAYGGYGPGMYAYEIFRNAIQWAFESAALPIVKVSPWPYPYNAAYVVRHDFENSQQLISSIESSAQSENALGAKGDYYFCTGTLRVELADSPSLVASLRRAVSLYGATIGSHNGGLANPNDPNLQMSDYLYWHWGPDEVLDDQIPGYPSGSSYASQSISISYADIDRWMSGLNTNTRTWTSPWFNSIREGSNQILDALGTVTAGEQKISPFPHWTLSTQSLGKRFNFVSLPVSDWFIGPDVAQSMESGYDSSTIHALVDHYYNLGALINVYSHSISSDGDVYDYIQYSASKSAIWPANAALIFDWWTKRKPVQVTPTFTVSGSRLLATTAITGATDSDTAVELIIPNWQVASGGIQVKLDGAFADPTSYRIYNQGIKIKVGAGVSSVEVSYPLTGGPVAQDDSYSMFVDTTLNVAVPGLLSNDSGGAGPLTAALVTQPSHGSVSLNPNGSFSYTPTGGFIGQDEFAYLASDGQAESGVATVTINVQPTWSIPVAQNDAYSVVQGFSLTISAPGILANDTGGNSSGLTAVLVSSPSNGTLTLNPNGSFTYTPSGAFSGIDAFTYQATSGGITSDIATVTITVTTAGSQTLFTDDFSGPSGVDPLFTSVLGSWAVAGGVMQGSSATGSYAFAYAGSNWADYSIQAQIQVPTGSYGGGVGGRVNTATGAHYGVWIYPGSSTLKLVKFSGWGSWSGAPMAQVNLPTPDTAWHTLLVTFQGNRIQVSYDGVQYLDVTDNGFDSVPAFSSGGISLDLWTSSTPYQLNFDNILVQTAASAPVAQNDSYSVTQGSTLTVTAPGVLANDTGGGAGVTAILVTQPANGTLNLASDGSFTYIPQAAYTGTDSFNYQASFGGLMSNTAIVTIVVLPPAISSITLNPATVIGSVSAVGTVTLTGPAPSAGAVVTLTSGNTAVATVPASTTVAPNATTTTFTVNTTPVASDTPVTLTASYGNSTQTGGLTVTSPLLNALSVNPSSVPGGASSTGTVTLTGPAAAGGTTVNLSSSNTSAATVPASVTVAANATTASFTIGTSGVAGDTSVIISASYSSQATTATLTVTAAGPGLNAIGLNPSSVLGGGSSTGTVTLSGPAPPNGAVIGLTSSNPSAATVPTSVTVAANAMTATFTVTTNPVSTNISVTVSATCGANTRTANLTVGPATLNSLSLSPTSVRGGTSSTGTVALNGPAPAGGAMVSLTSSNASVATIPVSVTIPANATSASFPVTTQPVFSNTSITISATYGSNTRTTSLTVTSATLSSLSLSPTSVLGGNSSTGTVILNGQAPASGAVISLTSSNTSVATVPSSVTVLGNATTTTFTITTKPAASNTSVTISALYGSTRTASLTVTAATLSSVSLNPSTVKGGTLSTGKVTLSGPAPAGGAVVTLTSSRTSTATVPASVTVAASATAATFAVTSKPVTRNTSATIAAVYRSVTRRATLTVTP
jgi:Bacterial Ig domain/3-keto-disaccharide hydrolase